MYRFFDLFFALLILPFFLVSYIVLYFVFKAKYPEEKLIFKQARTGLNSEMFNIYKFTTIPKNSKPVVYHKSKNLFELDIFMQFLRDYKIDELPQVVNLFLGDLSMVGPRPYQKFELEQSCFKNIILSVKPGLTGLWQSRYSSYIYHSKKFWLDSIMIKNMSFKMYFFCIFKTTLNVLKITKIKYSQSNVALIKRYTMLQKNNVVQFVDVKQKNLAKEQIKKAS